MVERLNGIEEVWGSNPHGSTKRFTLQRKGDGGHWFPGINAAEFDEAAIGEIGRKAGYSSLVNFLHEAHDRFGDAPRKRLQQND